MVLNVRGVPLGRANKGDGKSFGLAGRSKGKGNKGTKGFGSKGTSGKGYTQEPGKGYGPSAGKGVH